MTPKPPGDMPSQGQVEAFHGRQVLAQLRLVHDEVA